MVRRYVCSSRFCAVALIVATGAPGPNTQQAPASVASSRSAWFGPAMWNRLPSNDPAIRWGGDREAGQAVLAVSLVP